MGRGRVPAAGLYNVGAEDFHTYFVGRPGDTAVYSHNGTGNEFGVPEPTAAEQPAAVAAAEAAVSEGATAEAGTATKQNYLFRGDDSYRGGPVGRALGKEADAAHIQTFADHVLRKESNLTSRYASFTEEVKVARKFTSAADNRFVSKADMAVLRELEAAGTIRIWGPDQVHASLRAGPKKLSKQAADVRAAMTKNREVLIEGRIPDGVLNHAD